MIIPQKGSRSLPTNNNSDACSTSNNMLDDDSSTCSTMAVLDRKRPLDATSSEPVALAAVTSLKKKSVRFNQDANEFYSNTRICKEECAELWYSAAEYRHFKATIKFLAQEINNYEVKSADPFSYQRIVLRTYEACRQSSNSSNANCNDSSSSSSVLTSMEEQHLKRWLQGSPMRCGLEFVAIQDLGRGRHSRRQNILQVVMDFQNEMDRSVDDGNSSPDTTTDPAQYLREACEAVSRPSRMFARHLAQAAAPLPPSLY
jgi:hypothetical protein